MTHPTGPEEKQTSLRVELKYCEACGGLQLRPVGSGLVFCPRCEIRLSEERVPLLQPLKRSRRKPRLPYGRVDLQGCADLKRYPSALEVCA